MKSSRSTLAHWFGVMFALFHCLLGKGQWVNDAGTGSQSLTSTTTGATVGTTAGTPPANFTIRGSEISTQSVFQFDTYGTYNSTTNRERESIWRLFRITNAAGTGTREIGNIFAAAETAGSLNNGFYIKQMQANAALHLRNSSDNGIRLIDDVTTTVNGYTNQNVRHGYIGVGSNTAGNNMQSEGAPWARVHAFHQQGAGVQTGWRPHMRNGYLCTGNSDLSYFGHMYDMGAQGTGAEQGDNSNALIGWGSSNIDAATNVWDNCTFRFYANPASTTAGNASSIRGLEIMRLRPYRATTTSAIEGFVGIGDWVGTTVLPEERLDVLNGAVRVRDLPSTTYQAPNTDYDKVVVVRSNGNLNWRAASTLTGATDCDWDMQNPTTSGPTVAHDVWTAYGTNDACPDADDNVGIGIQGGSTGAKLDVYRQANGTGTINRTGQFRIEGTAPGKEGLFVQATGTGLAHYAIQTRASGADGDDSGNKGVIGWASDQTSDETTWNVGVDGTALSGEGETTGNVVYNIGVSGKAQEYGTELSPMAQHNWGGYFEAIGTAAADTWAMFANGYHFTTSGFWTTSDADLKMNIEDAPLDEAVAALNTVQLHTYDFNPDVAPQLQLPQGNHLGVLAEELQQNFPQLVRQAHAPAQFNQDGQETLPGYDFSAVNMDGLIPYLIAGFQVQQQQIAAQNETIAQMQEMLASCCEGGMAPGGGGERIDGLGSNEETILGNARALTIQPNPFEQQTTLYYTLERAGRMQLLANSADGKQLKVLDEAQRAAGQYQLEWNTTDLSPGVYYITLLLDGEPVVKKAVKVQR